jgi:hypothetical protein
MTPHEPPSLFAAVSDDDDAGRTEMHMKHQRNATNQAAAIERRRRENPERAARRAAHLRRMENRTELVATYLDFYGGAVIVKAIYKGHKRVSVRS